MSGDLAGGIAMGVLACLLGIGGIVAALRRRAGRAEIAATYGATGGVVYTIIQAGCSGVLLIGGIVLIVVVLVVKR